MKKGIIVILIIIIAGSLIYFSSENEEELKYNPSITNVYIRLGVLNQIYAQKPDSFKIVREKILNEEGITEQDLADYKQYLNENPQMFIEFLDTVEIVIDTLLSRPRLELMRKIYPKDFPI
ncbi:MAG: hypothetical protein GF307_06415 [candidate division Zixibacteria bacterium]|nr:hypothetical protein [candidate division Zixibacteria bacterium]